MEGGWWLYYSWNSSPNMDKIVLNIFHNLNRNEAFFPRPGLALQQPNSLQMRHSSLTALHFPATISHALTVATVCVGYVLEPHLLAHTISTTWELN